MTGPKNMFQKFEVFHSVPSYISKHLLTVPNKMNNVNSLSIFIEFLLHFSLPIT